jgi:predicted DNA-binding protein with PD1-like motif
MQTRQMGKDVVVRLEAGDEVIDSLTAWGRESGVGFAAVLAIGALEGAVLGYFDRGTSTYRHLRISEQVEVVALNGNISRDVDGAPKVHVHAILARDDGSTVGGHLVEGTVFPTLEVVVLALPGRVERRQDPISGLALWDLSG